MPRSTRRSGASVGDGVSESSTTRQGAGPGTKARWLFIVRLSLALLLSAAVLAWLLAGIDSRALAATLADADLLPLCLGALAGLAVVGLRCQRLANLTGRPLDRAAGTTFLLYNAAVALLPAKLGELALPVLLRQRHGASLWHSGGLVVLLRVYDLLFVAGLAAASTLLLAAAEYPLPDRAAAAAAALLLICIAVACGLPTAGRRALAQARGRWPNRHRLLARLGELSSALTSLSGTRLRRHLLETAALWAALVAVWVCATAAFAGREHLLPAVLAGSLSSFAFALPINGVANLGPVQAVWVWTACGFGLPMTAAVVIALTAHLIPLLAGLLGGATALVALAASRTAPVDPAMAGPSGPTPVSGRRSA